MFPHSVLLFLACIATLHAQDHDPRALLGGDTTVFVRGVNAFGIPLKGLSRKERRAFVVGNSFFKDNWVASPSSTPGRDGLGPFFNARSCSSCHLRDGRGGVPAPGVPSAKATPGLLLRLGQQGDGPDTEHPLYGGQLQEHAARGGEGEASFVIEVEEHEGRYGDGTSFRLAAPRYRLSDASFGKLGPNTTLGARLAPQLVGLGLLEAVPTKSLRALEDPEDRDGDGISGRIHWVPDRRTGKRVAGRFGWKATQPDVEQQTAAAFVNDIGITSSLFPDETLSAAQRKQGFVQTPKEVEIDDHKLGRVSFYCQVLAVPARRALDDSRSRKGEELFESIGCAKCHRPLLRTGPDAPLKLLRNQTIRPYTDLLLHDLGPELADTKRDGDARPAEWRTPPLWGLGLLEEVGGEPARYLHDGRARSVAEAILWHGGEGKVSRESFRKLPRADREALLFFLSTL